jgi:hypothetical protein
MTAWGRAGRTATSPSRLARAAPLLRGFGLDRLSPAQRGLAKRLWFRVRASAPFITNLPGRRKKRAAEAERATVLLESTGQLTVTLAMVRTFAKTARERMRIDGGGYRRDHLRALAQRVEVADGEVRIMGSKSDLLRTLAAASGVKSATSGVPSSVLKWRPVGDSNPCRRRERAVS